jgi:hypothetical protein
MICALAQSPIDLGQALTEDLGPDHRIKAAKRLCRAWQIMLPRDHELQTVLANTRQTLNWAKKNKDDRNKLVHWQWIGLGESELYCFKYTLRPPPEDDPAESAFQKTEIDDIKRFCVEIGKQSEVMRGLISKLETLPPWREIDA